MSGDVASGPQTPVPVRIDAAVLAAMFHEARRAFPAECCGWLTGPAGRSDALRPCANEQGVSGGHPSTDGRGADSAYVIAGADLLAFARAFRDASPPQILYHSHPNGRAYFSNTDRLAATSPWGDGPAYPVQQLVVGLDEHRIIEAALFAWSDADGGFIEIARLPGADT